MGINKRLTDGILISSIVQQYHKQMIKPCGICSFPSSHTANYGMRRGENYSIKEWKKNRVNKGTEYLFLC
jgi:hypothetical protein